MRPSELIAEEKNWLKRRLATDANDVDVTPPIVFAQKFCVIGAVMQGCHSYKIWDGTARQYISMACQLLNVQGPKRNCLANDLVDFNNHPDTTHAMILDLTQRVEAALYEEGELI